MSENENEATNLLESEAKDFVLRILRWCAREGRLLFHLPAKRPDNFYDTKRKAMVSTFLDDYDESLCNTASAELLLDQIRAIAQMRIDAARGLDAKALGLATVTAAIVGVVVAFALRAFWSLFALVPLVLSMVCSLIGSFVRDGYPPTPELLMDTRTFQKDGIAYEALAIGLAAQWADYAKDLSYLTALKGFWVRLGGLFLVVGLVALILVAVMAPVLGK